VLGGALLLIASCGTAGGSTAMHPPTPSASPPHGAVQLALYQLARGTERVSMTVSQVPAQGTVATAAGTLTPGAGRSDVLFTVNGGGFTEFSESAGTLRLRSYNTAAERQAGQWIPLDSGVTTRVLAWPPAGMDDPTFALASADWPRIISRYLSGSEPVGLREVDGTTATGYQLQLRLFKSAPKGQAAPRLDCWIDGAGELRLLTLRWPVPLSQSTGGGATQNSQNAIIVTMKVSGSGPGR
jgi:hypothetical protein